MPPGHPIILLKSNKFNMAAVSVKRSIVLTPFVQYPVGKYYENRLCYPLDSDLSGGQRLITHLLNN